MTAGAAPVELVEQKRVPMTVLRSRFFPFVTRRRWLAASSTLVLGLTILQPVAGAAVAVTPVHAVSTATADPLDNDTITPAELLGSPPLAAPDARTQLDVTVAAGTVSLDHTVDVALVVPAEKSSVYNTFISDSAARDLVAKTGAYWKAQSDNQVTSVTVTHLGRYSTAVTCADLQSADSRPAMTYIWGNAALNFGHSLPNGTPDFGYYLAGTGHHLLVLVPDACGGAGIGSVGAPVSAANGGVIMASMNGVNNLDIVAHEFGHNLGLQHSNIAVCPDASMSEGFLDTSTGTFTDGCADLPYQDAYDVMGAAYSYNGEANAAPTALNTSHKFRLNALADGETQAITLDQGVRTQETSATIVTTGAVSGRRALVVTDPRTQQVYYVDYRGGTGSDAGSLYTRGLLASEGVDNGVRILTTRSDSTSVVLLSPSPTSSTGHKLFLTKGQSLSTRSGGIRVVVQSIAGGAATVTVTLTASSVDRLFGDDRFATSAAISRANFAANAPVVYIANGLNFPDALSAAPVAGAAKAPILLVTAGSVPNVIQAELARLHPKKIVVLGDQNSVSDAAVAQVTSFAADPAAPIVRLFGDDRFATSTAISAANFPLGAPVVYIANGLKFPDALSAAPVAGGAKAPILLVTADSIPPVIQAELDRLNPTSFVVLGSQNSVSDAVVGQLKGYTADPATPVVRLSGDDRFATSAAISAANFPLGATVVYIANGVNFPDALSAAPVAGAAKAPILLVQPGGLSSVVQTELRRLHPTRFVVLGGQNSVGDVVVAQLNALIP
ncbi:cell wall-binding repeat-containing protein [Cryobacterium zhongshanensis]|uniref:Cell wall-binding repeat-containing protein n=1 Tax=Cryobacterium zhongshanensis TaxID=2928153 RepID=A0AA41QV68_9MICO|nr:cell wall-binding repeat-containing protein [Cryobacterium zhongshanensis]MCI4658390.1 cell wall-binding repeat-containing protein [Cryobacterium zhongshanensis]